MIGAITGGIIGSVHEKRNIKITDFPLLLAESTFTDDSVFTVTLAVSILHGGDYRESRIRSKKKSSNFSTGF